MKKIYIYLCLFLCSGAVFAQTPRQVSGVVKDTAGVTVIGATLKLAAGTDTLRMSSKNDGTFVFNNVKLSQFVLTVSSIGYRTQTRKYAYNDGAEPIVLEPIVLKEESQVLGTVNISTVRSVIIKEDTIEYRASDYKLPVNSTTEDLLKKVPGLEVDKDGNVTAQGKSVTKVRVNGKDFFGGDLQAATKNLPADLIERIQIIDDYGDQANLTGSRNGESEKIINIQIRPDRNKGYFGNGVAGVGRDLQTPDGERHQLSANFSQFDNSRQLVIFGNINNTNTSLFNFGNGGGGGGGGNNGGGGGGGNFGGGGGGGNRGGGGGNNGGGGFGNNGGIADAGAIGFNYRDQWGKKLTTYGSYSYSNRNTDLLSNIYQKNVYAAGDIIGNQAVQSNTENLNHRFNWNFEWLPDSVNFVKFSPSVTYSKSDGISDNTLAQSGNSNIYRTNQATQSKSLTKTPNIGANLLLNHRFHKPRRNVSLNLSINSGDTDIDQETDFNGKYFDFETNQKGRPDSIVHQQIVSRNSNMSTSSRFLFIEPLGKRSTLELNWNYSRANYDNKRETYDLLKSNSRVDSLSNLFNYSFTANNFGLTYRFTEVKYNYSLGLSGQPSVLDGESLSSNVTAHRTGFNFVPIARFTYKFSRSKELSVNYFGRNTEPTFQQIQPVADRSNPNNPIIGNPNLNAEFNHSLNLRFNNTQFTTGRTLFTNINAQFTNDKIVNNTVPVIVNKINTQEIRFLNADGYYQLNAFYSYSVPVAKRKYIFSYGGSGNFANNIAYSNNLENISKNLLITQRLRVQVNPAPWIELNPQARYIINNTVNSLSAVGSDNKIRTWDLSADGKLYFLKTMVLGVDYSKNINSGYNGTVSISPQILNMYLEKQFFKDKRGTLRLQGYDLFNENTGLSNSQVGNLYTETRSNRLGRYFMMTFTMRLQKFAGGAVAPEGMQQNPNRRDGGFGGGGRPQGGN